MSLNRFSSRRRCFNAARLVAAILILSLAAASPAHAKGRGGGGSGGGNAGNGGYGGNAGSGNQTSKTNKSSDPATVAASAEVDKDQAALNQITTDLRTTFEASPDFIAAQAALAQSQNEYNAERKSVLNVLKNNPDYVTAMKARTEAQHHVEELHSDPNSVSAEVSAAAKVSFAATQRVSELENNAFNADDHLGVLKTSVTDAGQKLVDLRKAFTTSLASNANWSAAKATLDDAQQKLDAARKAAAG